MARPRLCFTLLYANGVFNLSRNFNLQAVGNLDWILENYEFESMARSIDELIVLNVDRESRDWGQFVRTVQALVRHCFMPVAVGGGIRTFEQARQLFENGADKLVLNSAFFSSTALVRELVVSHGSQSIVASLDFSRGDDGEARVLTECGAKYSGLGLSEAVTSVSKLGAGELYLTSIDRDGTGMGYDLQALEVAYRSCDLPIIASGGADTGSQLAEGIRSGFASGAATSHLFNFMCDGLEDARREMIAEGIDLSRWDFEGILS